MSNAQEKVLGDIKVERERQDALQQRPPLLCSCGTLTPCPVPGHS